jgi:hypothetical protein
MNDYNGNPIFELLSEDCQPEGKKVVKSKWRVVKIGVKSAASYLLFEGTQSQCNEWIRNNADEGEYYTVLEVQYLSDEK